MNSATPALCRTMFACALLGVLGALPAFGQAPEAKKKQPPSPPLKETVATDIPGVIKGGTKIVLIKEGFNATEGVIALNDGSGSVLFTEQDANRIIKVDPSDNISTFLENTRRTTGLTYDPKGRLVGANSRPASIGTLLPEPRVILAESFGGQPLCRPNDLIGDKKGGFYFSDPAGPDPRFPAPPPGRTSLLLYITPDGKVVKPTEDTLNPNGIQLTADEKTLYVTNGQNIMAYDVQPDGMLKNGREFVKSGGDGIAIDSEGRLYSAVGGVRGIRVFDKTGKDLGTIPIGVPPQSVGFAGKDRRTLYVVGQGALYKVQGAMLSQGILVRAK